MSDTRQHVHELIDQLPSAKLNAVAGLLEVMIHDEDEDEEISAEEEAAVARSKDWFQHNQGIPFEQVVADLGFTMDEIRKASAEPHRGDPAA